MTKICLIGDSHLGALKCGMEMNSFGEPNFELTFFSIHNRNFPALRLQGRRLEGDSDELRQELAMFSGGRDSIEIDAYDEFVIVGHGLFIGYLVDIYRDHNCDCMPGPARGRYLLSDSCFLASSMRILERTGASIVGRWIRSLCDKPITFVTSPNPGWGLPESDEPEGFPPYYAAVQSGDAEALASLFREACARFAAAHAARVVPPVVEAAKNGLFNHYEYSLLSEMSTPNSSQSDRIAAMHHGNCRYGTILARYVFDR